MANRLLHEMEGAWVGPQMSASLRTAIINSPRHFFLERYQLRNDTTWHKVSLTNIEEHLPNIYQDQPLALIRPNGSVILSAQSKPSFIFSLIDALEIEKGHNVLEIGSGSGWLAAVMGSLVGSSGNVFGVEILHEAVMLSRRALARADRNNVYIIEADGVEGHKIGAPYDRVVITACTPTFPSWLFDQIRLNGCLIIPLRVPGGGDCMFLMERRTDCFRSKSSIYSLSVPMGGRATVERHPPYLMDRADADRLRLLPVSHSQWPGDSVASAHFLERTLECRAFMSITEEDFVAYNVDPPGTPLRQSNLGFGIEDHRTGSLAIATGSGIITFGSAVARDRLESAIATWSTLSKSDGISFELTVYPHGATIPRLERSWMRSAAQSSFLWRLF